MGDISKELDKISEKEKHIKDNKIEGVIYKNQKIFNMIVFLDEMFGMNQYAREKIKEKMKIGSDNFYIFGCWEFELICQQSKDRQQNLLHSVQDMIAGRSEIFKVDFLDRLYHDFFDSIKNTE